MSKLMLLIEEPKTCFDCPCLIVSEGACFCQAKNEWTEGQERPSWCPLRPLPEKIEEGEEPNIKYGISEYAVGRNDVIDEILGETE